MKSFKMANLLVIAFSLALIYGCSGGGSGSLLSALGGGSGSGDDGGGGDDGGLPITVTTHNPEPSSLLLLGSGLLGMAIRARKKAKK